MRAIDTHTPEEEIQRDMLFLKAGEVQKDLIKLFPNPSKKQRYNMSRTILEEKLQETREREAAQLQPVIEPVKDPIVLKRASCYSPLPSLGGKIGSDTWIEKAHRGSKRYHSNNM
jgi:hypothetical protein